MIWNDGIFRSNQFLFKEVSTNSGLIFSYVKDFILVHVRRIMYPKEKQDLENQSKK